MREEDSKMKIFLKKVCKTFGNIKKLPYLCTRKTGTNPSEDKQSERYCMGN